MQIALILLAAVFAFGAGLWNGHVYDDFSIVSDPVLFAPSGWWEIWPAHTRPLTYLTFWLELQAFGAGASLPHAQHAVNLSIHLIAVWLAYGALRRLLPERAALIATLIFAIHPLQGEAVNYVWARSTLLMTVFCLLSLRDWLRGRRRRAVVWFGVALLAKEECGAFPVFLLLVEFTRGKLREVWRPAAAMLVLSAAAGARVLWFASMTAGSQAGSQAPYSMPEYFWTQGRVILRYLRLTIVPAGLTPDPGVETGMHWWAWILIAGAGWLMWRHYRTAGLWLAGGLILLLPSSSIFPASELSAGRRMYLPMVAFAAMFGVMLQRWHRPALAAAAMVLAPLSAARTLVWQSDETLWSDALAKNAKSVRARLLLVRGRTDPNSMIPLLQEAKKLDPDNAGIASQLGRAYVALGRPEQALPEFGRALAHAPNSPEALSNRGVALLMLKQNDAARQDFERALTMDRCFWDALYNLRRMGADVQAPGCRYTPWQQQMLDEIR
jgi:protein O-mannosyl-transferase